MPKKLRALLMGVLGPRIKSDTLRRMFYRHFLKGCIVGDHTYGIPTIITWGEGAELRIGKFCSISAAVTVILGGNHRTDWVTTYPFPAFPEEWPEAREIIGHPQTKGDVIVGNDVWLGFGATIMSGVNLGDGAVVGAMAVVTNDVAPYSIVAGNPAREVGKRFDEETIAALLELRWWDWPVHVIKENIHQLCGDDIDSFITKFRKG